MSTHLRIRDNGKVIELNIPKNKLEELQKIVASNIMDKTKHLTIRKMTGGSPCCVYDGIPAYEIAYPVPDGGATRIERYVHMQELAASQDIGPLRSQSVQFLIS